MRCLRRTSLIAAIGLLASVAIVAAEDRRGDVIMKFGPPHQVMKVDKEEFWIYRWSTPNEQSLMAERLRAWGSGVQGIPYTPRPQMDPHSLIFRFGPDGELKADELR
jgi:hypothetical protein